MAANRFLSIPYLLLRSSTAGGGLLAGLIQTFVFARILTPERFSTFILVGTVATTLWLSDLGMAKIIFVRMRSWFLGEREADADIARHATAIVILYFLLSVVGTIACFAGTYLYFGFSALESLELSLFFLFTAEALVWYAIRNISVAVDDFIFFESLEAMRRAGHIAVMLLPLAGVSLMGFLIIGNLIWAALFAVALARLSRKSAVVLKLAGFWSDLRHFFHDNRKDVFQTGIYASNEFYIYTFPYFVVPVALGLGAPTIILDTAFKVLRGATVLYSAGCDIAVPRQTRAYNERDRKNLILATLMAAALSSLPCLIIALLLAFASGPFFALLLGNAATVPPAVSWLLIVLLVASLIETVSTFLLVYTGFFNMIARVSMLITVAMTLVTIIAVAAKVDLVGFLQAYTAVFVSGALCYLSLALRGPLRVK